MNQPSKWSSSQSGSASADTTPRRSLRRVRFSCPSETEIHVRADYGDDHATWYTRAEYKSMTDRVRPIVKAMRLGRQDLLSRDGISTRGLEHLESNAHFEQQMINRDCVIEAVFGEQRRQRAEGVYDEVEISNSSRIASRWARNMARQLGASDEAAVQFDSVGSSTCCGISNCSLTPEDLPPVKPSAPEDATSSRSPQELSWLSHNDSLRQFAIAQHEISSVGSKESRDSFSSTSSKKSVDSCGNITKMPIPLGERPPSVEQAFAA